MNKQFLTPAVKRELISLLQTFLATFLAVLAMEFQNLTPESFGMGAIVGAVLASMRAGVKAVWVLLPMLIRR